MSQMIISLDFELMWGVRDHHNIDSYGDNVLGARAAIPRILEIFSHQGVEATWATVGLLFCEDRAEMLERISRLAVQPKYIDGNLSAYTYLNEVGRDENEDPFSFGLSLIRLIAQTPGQRVGTHTFSHYYCLEPCLSADAFRADLNAALEIARDRNIDIKSIVFPRNQYNVPSLKVCSELGIESFRGNPTSWFYAPTAGSGQSRLRRAGRLVDAYTGVAGDLSQVLSSEYGLVNLPASRFLRPQVGRLRRLAPLHIATIIRGMEYAAKRGRDYHLWWHPHNFGRDTDVNIDGLKKIIAAFHRLRNEYGMQSASMETAA